MKKSDLGLKLFIWLTGYSQSFNDTKAGTQGSSRNLEAGAKAVNMEEHCLLAYFLYLAQLLLLYSLGPPT